MRTSCAYCLVVDTQSHLQPKILAGNTGLLGHRSDHGSFRQRQPQEQHASTTMTTPSTKSLTRTRVSAKFRILYRLYLQLRVLADISIERSRCNIVSGPSISRRRERRQECRQHGGGGAGKTDLGGIFPDDILVSRFDADSVRVYLLVEGMGKRQYGRVGP